MEKLASGDVSLPGLLLLAAGAAVVLAPLIILVARTAYLIRVMAALLCLAAVAASLAAPLGALVGAGLIAGLAGSLWLGALICALAAYLDFAADRRSEDMTFRLLHQDADRLPVPEGLAKKYRRERGKPPG